MDIEIRPLNEVERKYTYTQSSQLTAQTGCIGHLRADMDTDGTGFFTSWDDHYPSLKTQKFKDELDEVINALRFSDANGGILKNRSALASYCYAHPEASFGNDREFGIRVDTDEHSYLFRLNPNRGEYNVYCYCYKRDWLDRNIERAENGIRFITPDYKDKFRIADGEQVRIYHSDGSFDDRTCRYVDDCHLEVGSNLFHICEFAERMERSGCTVIPKASVLPVTCFAQHPETGEVILLTKGEQGYQKTADYPGSDHMKNKSIVEKLNRNSGVTKAQVSAMLAGSMFGFDVPAADPRNYDENGFSKPVRGNRFNAMSEKYEQVEVCGVPAMFTSTRIARETVPNGMYMYEVRHADENWGEPCQLAKGIMVNHFGTIITSKPIELPPDGHRDFDSEKEWRFSAGTCRTLASFMREHPPEQQPPDRKNGAR